MLLRHLLEDETRLERIPLMCSDDAPLPGLSARLTAVCFDYELVCADVAALREISARLHVGPPPFYSRDDV